MEINECVSWRRIGSRSEHLYVSIFNCLFYSVYRTVADGWISLINTARLRMLGLHAADTCLLYILIRYTTQKMNCVYTGSFGLL